MKRIVGIQWQGLTGSITWNTDMVDDFEVVFPDEDKWREIMDYLATPRECKIPESQKVDDYRTELAYPTDSAMHFSLALSSLYGVTDVKVIWA